MKHQQHNIEATRTSNQRLHIIKAILVMLTVSYGTVFVSATTYGNSIAESYPAADVLQPGLLVSLSDEDPNIVEPAQLNNNEYLLGVVVGEGDSLVSFEKDGATVNVATDGTVYMFVSDVNGDIQPGDFIGTSWINGVGMRAEQTGNQKLAGVALEDFTVQTVDAVEVEKVDIGSAVVSARIGKIAVRLFEREAGDELGQSSSAFEQIAFRIAGKDVPFVRIIAAFGLFTISVIIAGVFLANAIKSSLISIGRNPLAHGSIFTTLTQISGVSVGLVIIGAALAYIMLIL